MVVDATDRKILGNLDYNARIPLSDLAKKVNLSKQNLHYRLNKLIESKTILDFTSVVDIHRLGYLTYRLYIRLRQSNRGIEKKIIAYFKKHSNVIWFVSIYGGWDFEVVMTARNFIHFNNLLKKIRRDIGEHFLKSEISMVVVNYHFQRDYLLDKKRSQFTPIYYGFEPHQQDLDLLDQTILKELSRNCRQSNADMGAKTGVSYKTVKHRIARLEERNIIQSHRIRIDMEKIGRTYYKIGLSLDNPSEKDEKQLYAFCNQHNFVVYLVEVLGSSQFEIEMEVDNQETLTQFVTELRTAFSKIISDYYIMQVTKEHYLNYLPPATVEKNE